MDDNFEEKVKEFLDYLEQEILKNRKTVDVNKLVDVNESYWFIDSCGTIDNSVFGVDDEYEL